MGARSAEERGGSGGNTEGARSVAEQIRSGHDRFRSRYGAGTIGCGSDTSGHDRLSIKYGAVAEQIRRELMKNDWEKIRKLR